MSRVRELGKHKSTMYMVVFGYFIDNKGSKNSLIVAMASGLSVGRFARCHPSYIITKTPEVCLGAGACYVAGTDEFERSS